MARDFMGSIDVAEEIRRNHLTPTNPPPHPDRSRGPLYILIVLLYMACAGLFLQNRDLHETQMSIREEQTAGRERGYINRATACRGLVLQGAVFEEGDSCLEEEVLQHYDVQERIGGANGYTRADIFRAICLMVREQGIIFAPCVAVDE